jgi:hypothetical protein
MPIPRIPVPLLLDSPPAERIRALVPYLRDALDLAATQHPGGGVSFGVLVRTADGKGAVLCEFDLPSFVPDMAEVFGEGDINIAKANRILAMMLGGSS